MRTRCIFVGRLRCNLRHTARPCGRIAHSPLSEPGNGRERQNDLPNRLFENRGFGGRTDRRTTFTPEVLNKLKEKNIPTLELTLHVGAGTFKPVKSETLEGHEMHTEYISVSRNLIDELSRTDRRVIAVGTTSVRTLESLYYIGKMLEHNPNILPDSLSVGQWQPYDGSEEIDSRQSLRNIVEYLDRRNMDRLVTATQIIIAPGYRYHIVQGMITNFHQPQSTLLLLVSAFVNGRWREIYDYALSHDFRFLSYGDSSLLLP